MTKRIQIADPAQRGSISVRLGADPPRYGLVDLAAHGCRVPSICAPAARAVPLRPPRLSGSRLREELGVPLVDEPAGCNQQDAQDRNQNAGRSEGSVRGTKPTASEESSCGNVEASHGKSDLLPARNVLAAPGFPSPNRRTSTPSISLPTQTENGREPTRKASSTINLQPCYLSVLCLSVE
jgi:hypothetical protein